MRDSWRPSCTQSKQALGVTTAIPQARSSLVCPSGGDPVPEPCHKAGLGRKMPPLWRGQGQMEARWAPHSARGTRHTPSGVPTAPGEETPINWPAKRPPCTPSTGGPLGNLSSCSSPTLGLKINGGGNKSRSKPSCAQERGPARCLPQPRHREAPAAPPQRPGPQLHHRHLSAGQRGGSQEERVERERMSRRGRKLV